MQLSHLRLGPSVRKLSIASCPVVLGASEANLVLLSQLTSLNLGFSVLTEGFFRVLSQCTGLRSLRCHVSPRSGKVTSIPECIGLTDLHVAGWALLPVSWIFNHGLKCLSVRNRYDASALQLNQPCLPALETFTIGNANFEEDIRDMVTWLATGPTKVSLRSLHIGAMSIDIKEPWSLPDFTALTSLSVSALYALPKLPHLTELNVYAVGEELAVQLSRMPDCAPRLQALGLFTAGTRGEVKWSTESMLKAAHKLSELEHLQSLNVRIQGCEAPHFLVAALGLSCGASCSLSPQAHLPKLRLLRCLVLYSWRAYWEPRLRSSITWC